MFLRNTLSNAKHMSSSYILLRKACREIVVAVAFHLKLHEK